MSKSGHQRELEAGNAFYEINNIAAIKRFESNPEAQYVQKEKLAILERAADTPELKRRKKYLEYYYIYGYSYAELAAMLDISKEEAEVYIKESIEFVKHAINNI